MPDLLSRQASELAEILGEDGLEELIERCRGQRLHIHIQPRPDSELARRLGSERYGRLQPVYRGDVIEVPSPRRRHRDDKGRFAIPGASATKRAERVHALRAEGRTIAEIAYQEGVSKRWVHLLLSAFSPPQTK